MIKSIGRHAMAVLAIGGAGIVSAPLPAHASTFSAAYTCTVPVLGTRKVVITGSLTASPDRVAIGQPIRFQLHIERLSLQSPVAIDSWTAIAGIDVNGAQTTSFRVAGAGGTLGPRQPVSGDLYGSWTPKGPGVDRLRGGTVVISAKVARVGVLTASCQPITPRPVLETVTVLSVHRPLRARYLNMPDV